MVLHKARSITMLRLLWKLSPIEFGESIVFSDNNLDVFEWN